jgi:hypothetical protein
VQWLLRSTTESLTDGIGRTLNEHFCRESVLEAVAHQTPASIRYNFDHAFVVGNFPGRVPRSPSHFG